MYHSGKANIVANALSRQGTSITVMMVHELLLLEQLSDLSISLSKEMPVVFYKFMRVQSDLVDRIR